MDGAEMLGPKIDQRLRNITPLWRRYAKSFTSVHSTSGTELDPAKLALNVRQRPSDR